MAQVPSPPPGQEVLHAILRRDLGSFVQKAFATVNLGDTYVPGWHVEALCHELTRVRAGQCSRLIVNQPPRSLKSLVTSVAFPAWIMGQDPTARVIAISYSEDLSRRLARDYRRVVEAPWYRAAFPGMRIDSRKNTETEVVTTQGGFRYATSVGGTLTGRGGDVIIIDDPIKPMEAASDSERQKVNEWFDSTVISRLDDPARGALVLVMQRVHEHDLTGHLLEKGGWTQLRLPAIATEDTEIALDARRIHRRAGGDLLDPSRVSQEQLEEARRHLGSYLFEAQYQQDPIPAGGTLILADWLDRCSASSEEEARYDEIVQSWDVASKTGPANDWSVCTTWGLRRKTYTLLDVLRARLEFPDLLSRAKAHAKEHRAHRILIEDVSTGSALVQALDGEIDAAVIGIRPKLDKAARVQQASAVFEAGRVVLPKSPPWLVEYRRELLAFPGGRHDDQVDSTSQFLIWAEQRTPKLPRINPVFLPREEGEMRWDASW